MSEIDTVARTLAGFDKYVFDELSEDGDHPETEYNTQWSYREKARTVIDSLDEARLEQTKLEAF